ncbi:NAD(P)/FAD-dependent oxidoreductase [Ancylobacter radicis]|uniref:NAD(P)/FAD-dependent oxidoreductase n=1 Tax=Ancylobacter radicis TaxID=2836179 RepID=UPI002022C17B|nr:NAD(P)/FAD-dependent oxidoreductase [Ancylobacter radicis]
MRIEPASPHRRLNIAVVGSGISGLSAAWLLSQAHDVTLFEAEPRLGGHAHTRDAGGLAIDTGFIVYNTSTYPNLTALFAHLGVATEATDMSFAVSLDEGRLEYSGTSLAGLFAQKRNLVSPRYWSMLRDLLRFYREAPGDAPGFDGTLAAYLDAKGYGEAFREDHLYPMAAAIWSTPAGEVGRYPFTAFTRFCENHGLLKITGRPIWRTVRGGSREYVKRLHGAMRGETVTHTPVAAIRRGPLGVEVVDRAGERRRFDEVVLACHADQALHLLEAPTPREREVLGAFRYSVNEAILHSHPGLMPVRRSAWAAWNYLTQRNRSAGLSVTYWMNKLQNLPASPPMFVTLNPVRTPHPASIHYSQTYRHPLFDTGAMAAQKQLWSLQGEGGVWFCGAYFGAGFHEDGLQAGLAVAEALGGVRRPWSVDEESARIHIGPAPLRQRGGVAA